MRIGPIGIDPMASQPVTIDEYLDELLARLRGRPAAVRRTLAEAEAHLRDAADAEVAAGATPAEAEARAIARFGEVRVVARAANAISGGLLGTLVGPLLAVGARLAAVGFAAIAVGALLAHALAALTSTGFVFGVPGTAGRPAAANHWLAVQPGARGWRAAGALENSDDTLVLRLGLALAGLIVAVAVVIVTRRCRPLPGVLPVVGMTAFGGTGAVLLAGGLVDVYTPFEWGRGLWLVDGAVALAVGIAFAGGFLSDVRRRVA